MKEIALVVPSIREESFKRFVNEWSKVGLFELVDLILVEDNQERSFEVDLGPDVYGGKGSVVHYDWLSIEKILGVDSWIIPRRSDTVRSFGYYMAWRTGYKYILTLDDDCYPPTQANDGFEYKGGARGFIEMHKKALDGQSAWFNTLNKVKPRGIPFMNTGKNDRVVVNHGLWTNVLDYDAPTQLVNPIPEEFSYDSRIVPTNQYFPMCGMNVMWKADVTVLMYHMLMGKLWTLSNPTGDMHLRMEDHLVQLPFDRFGDIWCGIIMKRIVDIALLNVATGTPYIHHDRASSPFTNLKKEANGLEVNEYFWQYVDSFEYVGATTLFELYGKMGVHVSKYEKFPQYNEYFQRLGRAMVRWSQLFEEAK